MKELYKKLNKKYNLKGLLDGSIHIEEVLEDEEVVDFLSTSKYTLIEVEEYILHKIK